MANSTGFVISGTSMTVPPVSQTWEYIVLGDNFDGTKAYSRKKAVTLEFSDCTVAQFAQWSAKCGGSVVTADLLSPSGLVFTQYSNVVLDLVSRPKIQGVAATGSWSIRISEIISNAL